MTNKLYTLWLAICVLGFSLTAPIVVPFILLCTSELDRSLPCWAAWYDTPDEDDLFDLGEPQVFWWYVNFGWFMTAWHWFGFRNRGHGFSSWLARPAPADGKYGATDSFFIQKQIGLYTNGDRTYGLRFGFGWQIYNSRQFDSKYEYRPRVWIKTRHWSAA